MPENEKLVLKDVPSAQFDYIRGIYRSLCNNQYLRISEDVVPGRSMFVYRYFPDHLLSFALQDWPVLISKKFSEIRYVGLQHCTNETLGTQVSQAGILYAWTVFAVINES